MNLWRTPLGRLLCRLLTGGEHVWTGWARQRGYRPGFPLPMAYCVRCGGEF